MSTYTGTQTETSTHARHVAAKIAADLSRLRRLVGMNIPTDEYIRKFKEEAIMLLRDRYLDEVTYGFQKNGIWVLAIKYKAQYGGDGACFMEDNDPGGIQVGTDVVDSYFTSVLKYSNAWRQLPVQEKQSYKNRLPIIRVEGAEPGGDWGEYDKNYYRGNIGVKRKKIT